MSSEPIDPKDVAAGSAANAALRQGTAGAQGQALAVGAAAGAAQSVWRRRRPRSGSFLLTALLFIAVLVALLALMLYIDS